jgi:hypothetical protein
MCVGKGLMGCWHCQVKVVPLDHGVPHLKIAEQFVRGGRALQSSSLRGRAALLPRDAVAMLVRPDGIIASIGSTVDAVMAWERKLSAI